MAVNKITTVGRLVADPEARQAGSYPIAEIRIASPTATKQRNSEEYITNFYRVTIWNKNRCEYVLKNLKQGDMVCVSGDLTINMYKKTDGTTATSIDITATDVELMRRKGDGSSSAPTATPAPAKKPEIAMEDDLPF